MENEKGYCWLLGQFTSTQSKFKRFATESGQMFCQDCQQEKAYKFLTDKNRKIIPGTFQVDCPKRNS